MKKNLSYTELDRYTKLNKNEFGEDKFGSVFGGGNAMWLIDRGEVQKNNDFDERRCWR